MWPVINKICFCTDKTQKKNKTNSKWRRRKRYTQRAKFWCVVFIVVCLIFKIIFSYFSVLFLGCFNIFMVCIGPPNTWRSSIAYTHRKKSIYIIFSKLLKTEINLVIHERIFFSFWFGFFLGVWKNCRNAIESIRKKLSFLLYNGKQFYSVCVNSFKYNFFVVIW